MIFVISYKRSNGSTKWLGEFPDAEMASAQQLRLSSEIEARKHDSGLEVVVLTARNRDALRQTHSRYFGAELETNLRTLLGEGVKTDRV